MAVTFSSLCDLLSHGFDTVIDVRSPAEYAEDHMPGAINLPALLNEERAIVGTIYKQESPFRARKVGAAMVARNVAAHLEGPLADRDGRWRPLVHCWRGGQRSGSFAAILTQIGWRAETLAGGYRAYRGLVHDLLHDASLPHRIVLIDGNTGSAKTAILHEVAAAGGQVLDLEGLAHHRGSLLGAQPEGQPGQKAFESALAAALVGLDPTRPVLVEAESSRIGRLIVPPSLWSAMCAAPRIEIAAPLPARVAWLTEAYADLMAEPERLAARLQPLRRIRGHEVVDRWQVLLATRDFPALAEALMVEHYDPAYARSRAGHDPQVIATVEAPALDAPGRRAAAARIAGVLSGR